MILRASEAIPTFEPLGVKACSAQLSVKVNIKPGLANPMLLKQQTQIVKRADPLRAC